MLRLATLLLFALQLTSYGRVGEELGRLPNLVQHYGEHRQEDAQLNLLTFLWLHYGDSQHRESDSRHESLPLHCHGHAHLAEIGCPHAPTLQHPLVNTPTVEAPLRKSQSPFAFSWPVGYTGRLFQPPKA